VSVHEDTNRVCRILVESGEAILRVVFVELELVAREVVYLGVGTVEKLEEWVVVGIICERGSSIQGVSSSPCCIGGGVKRVCGGSGGCCVDKACGSSRSCLTDAASRAGWRRSVGVAVPFHDVAGVLCCVCALVVGNIR